MSTLTARRTSTPVALVLAAAALGASPAAAAPGLAIGASDGHFLSSWAAPLVDMHARELGLNVQRVFIEWTPGRTALTAEQRDELTNLPDRRTLATVAGPPGAPRPPVNARLRREYTAFLRDLATFEKIRDVGIWNEPSDPYFWGGRPQPQAYALMLAAAYDELRPLGIRVVAFEMHPSKGVARFIRQVAQAYRASGRERPLFDVVAWHPYPKHGSDAPWTAYGDHWFGLGDLPRLRRTVDRSFAGTGQGRVPFYVTEVGYNTASTHWRSTTLYQQGKHLALAVELAACQRRVRAVLTFLVRDDPDEWQTGVLDVDWQAKPAYAELRAAIAKIRSGRLHCGRFPASVL